MSTAAYYDTFSDEQVRRGQHERHEYCMSWMRTLGLKRTSSVLEIGCGVGIVTAMLSRICTEGRVVAVDISPRSVELARERVGRTRAKVDFVVAGAESYDPGGETFDFVAMFDVLEHIPLEGHGPLLSTVARAMHLGSWLLVSIPNPRVIDYLRAHQPDSLQVIDQALELDYLAEQLALASLTLHGLETYSLWSVDEYQFLRIVKTRPYSPQPLPPRSWPRRFIRRIRSRIQR